MDNLEQKLKDIVMTSIGAIVHTAQKVKEAAKDFVDSDTAKEFAKKGEEAVNQVASMGGKAVDAVKKAFTDADIQEKVEKERARLTNLAKQVSELSEKQREVFDHFLKEQEELAKKEAENVDLGDGLGRPGVNESAFDPQVNEKSYDHPQTSRKPSDPLDRPTPTAPDDEHNVRTAQTNTMNEHLKQNVPPDF